MGLMWRIFNLLVDGLFLIGVLNDGKLSLASTLFKKHIFLLCYVSSCLMVCFATNEWNCFYNMVMFIVPICCLILKYNKDRFSVSYGIVMVSCVYTVAIFCCATINMLVNGLPLRSWFYTHDIRVVVRYVLQGILYPSCLYILYKSKIFSGSCMKKVSNHIQAPILFVLYFSFSLYLRYRVNNATVVEDKNTLNMLYVVYLFLIPVFLVTYWLLAKLSSLRNIVQNGKYDEIFENIAIMPVHSSKINFSPDLYAYEKDKVIFRKKLANLGITNMECGYSHLVFSLIALSYLPEKEQVDIEKDILERVAGFIHKDPSTLRTEINNIIHRVWTQSDIETLKWGYEYSNDVKHNVPTVDEFLIHMVDKAS